MKTVACFGSGWGKIGEGPYDTMMEIGKLLAEHNVHVVTGGYGGSGMEAPLRGAELASDISCRTGYTLACRDKRPNNYFNRLWVIGKDILVEPNTPAIQYALRLGFLLEADGFVVDPSDPTAGTLIEFLSALNMNMKFLQTKPKPVVLMSTSIMGERLFRQCRITYLDRAFEQTWFSIHTIPATAVNWLLDKI